MLSSRLILAAACSAALLSAASAQAAPVQATPPSAPATAPYGTWDSPVTATLVSARAGGVGEVTVSGARIYWLEQRPAEQGRTVIVTGTAAGARDVLPQGFSARSMVQEYGGGDLLAVGDQLFFSNAADQRLYRLSAAGKDAPVAVTPADKLRFADCAARQIETLFCVREDHRGAGEAKNVLVRLDGRNEGAGTVLFSSSDFVASPRLSADGRKLAWLSWNHPNMPWDKTTLWMADVKTDGSLGAVREVASGAAIGEPQWGADGTLYFVSDTSGWWNLYRFRAGTITPVTSDKAEYSQPMWQLGQASYAILNDNTIIARRVANARADLVRIDIAKGTAQSLKLPYVSVGSVHRFDDRTVLFTGATETDQMRLLQLDVTTGKLVTITPQDPTPVAADYISRAEAIDYPTSNGDTAHGFYFPPRNPQFVAPAGTRPPLVVMAHGGPTANATPAYSSDIQFWTSRGFAVMQVNYRGSTGYGSAYRNKLKGQWGLADIDDTVNAAKYAVKAGLADPAKLIVRGGSAGGFVVLAAHAFHDTFATGANYYGVSDIAALGRDTHKFESRYLDGLVAPLPAGEKIYADRSPIHHLAGFKKPLIVFQGLDDKVVLPNQSEMVVDALRKKGIRVEYLTFEGEGHGFRKLENRVKALEAELAFYRSVLKL